MRFIDFLTSPSKSIEEPDQRRQSRFFSLMLLALILLSWVVEVISYFLYNRPDDPYTGYRFTIVSTIVLLIAYGISRTRHYILAVDLTVFIAQLSILEIVYFSDSVVNISFLNFVIFPVFISCLFFPAKKATAWIVILLASVLLIAVVWHPNTLYATLQGPFGLLGMFSVISLLLTAHRERVEREREQILSEQILLRTREQEETNQLLSQSVAELKEKGEELRSYLELEKIVADLSARFIHMPLYEIDAGIEYCLKTVAEFLGVDRSFVFLNSLDRKAMTNTHEWSAPGVPSQKQTLQNVMLSNFPLWSKTLSEMGIVLVTHTADLPVEAESERKMMSDQDLKSLLVFPLARENKIFGCLGLGSSHNEHIWLEHEVVQLKTVAEIVANALVHQNSEQLRQQKNIHQAQLIMFARQLSSTLSVETIFEMIKAMSSDLFLIQESYTFAELNGVAGGSIDTLANFERKVLKSNSQPLLGKIISQSLTEKRCLCLSAENALVSDVNFYPDSLPIDYLIIPFLSGSDLLGGICLVRTGTHFEQDDAQLAETFSALASAAIKNATIYASLQHEVDERIYAEKLQSALYHISEASYTTRNLDELITSIHQIVARLIPAKNLYVALYDSQNDMVSFPYFVDEKDQTPEPHRLENSLTDYVINSGKPLLINAETTQQLLNEFGLKISGATPVNWLGVPLKILNGKILGMMAIQDYNPHSSYHYTLKDQEIFTFVSAQVAMAIDRQNVQSALAESEARFHAVSDMTSDFAYAMRVEPDNSYGIIWVTDAIFRITGFTKEEMLAWNSSSISDLVHPEDRAEFEKIEKSWRANQACINTFRIVTKNLEIRYIRHIAHPIWSDDENRVVAVISAAQDITEQVSAAEQVELAHTELELRVQERTSELAAANETLRAEIAERKLIQQFLQESEERYRSVSETAKDGIVTINQKWEIVAWNKGAEQIFGYKLDEIVGQPLSIIVPAGLFAMHTKTLAANPHSGMAFDSTRTIEVSGLRRNEEQFPAELNFSSWVTRDGVFMTAFVRDITSRKAAEEALRRAYNENQQLLAAIKSILIVVNALGIVTFWNESAVNILEMDSDQVLGKRLDELNIAWDASILYYKIEECKISQQNVRMDDIFVQYPDHEERIIGFTVTPLTDINSGGLGALLLGSDVTKRRGMEQQLAQVQKLEAIGQLAAGIAHEINTPTQFVNSNLVFLNSRFEILKKLILLHTELKETLRAGESRLTPELANRVRTQVSQNELDYVLREFPKAMEQSLEGTERISHIVQAMREFSHPGGGHKIPTDINHALLSTIEVTRNAWKNVADLDLNLNPNLPLVDCLPAELNQSFLNILVNAVDAIREVVGEDPVEKGKIRIETLLEEPWVEIRISDTGCGIPEKIINRIFDPFFTTKEIGKGTGQGLTISRNIIVKIHKGEITCQSKPGIGTTFIIRLPLRGAVEAISE